MKKYKFISWGLGVQSTWLGVMCALGVLEPVDAIIFADTQWERRQSMQMLHFYKPWFESKGLKVMVTSAGSVKELGAREHVHVPFFTETGAPMRRQCTREFKIRPIRRLTREFAGYPRSKPPHPKAGQFEMWIGFSLDEWDRMKKSDIDYTVSRYKLIEMGLTRDDCIKGYEKLGLPVPGKSACVGCPYRDAGEWLEMKRNEPEEFEEACRFDEENRDNPLAERGKSTADKLYVWRGLKPLREVDFEAEMKKQKNGKQIPMVACLSEYCWT
jgi:hypothetical protein